MNKKIANFIVAAFILSTVFSGYIFPAASAADTNLKATIQVSDGSKYYNEYSQVPGGIVNYLLRVENDTNKTYSKFSFDVDLRGSSTNSFSLNDLKELEVHKVNNQSSRSKISDITVTPSNPVISSSNNTFKVTLPENEKLEPGYFLDITFNAKIDKIVPKGCSESEYSTYKTISASSKFSVKSNDGSADETVNSTSLLLFRKTAAIVVSTEISGNTGMSKSGIEYTLKDIAENNIYTATTDSSGKAYFINLNAGGKYKLSQKTTSNTKIYSWKLGTGSTTYVTESNLDSPEFTLSADGGEYTVLATSSDLSKTLVKVIPVRTDGTSITYSSNKFKYTLTEVGNTSNSFIAETGDDGYAVFDDAKISSGKKFSLKQTDTPASFNFSSFEANNSTLSTSNPVEITIPSSGSYIITAKNSYGTSSAGNYIEVQTEVEGYSADFKNTKFKYELRDSNDSLVGSAATTNDSGIVKFENLTIDKVYKLKIIDVDSSKYAFKSFKVGTDSTTTSNPVSITVKSGQNKVNSIVSEYTTLEIKKQIEGLSGFDFTTTSFDYKILDLTDSNNAERTIRTNSSGIAYFDKVIIGHKYKLSEYNNTNYTFVSWFYNNQNYSSADLEYTIAKGGNYVDCINRSSTASPAPTVYPSSSANPYPNPPTAAIDLSTVTETPRYNSEINSQFIPSGFQQAHYVDENGYDYWTIEPIPMAESTTTTSTTGTPSLPVAGGIAVLLLGTAGLGATVVGVVVGRKRKK